MAQFKPAGGGARMSTLIYKILPGTKFKANGEDYLLLDVKTDNPRAANLATGRIHWFSWYDKVEVQR